MPGRSASCFSSPEDADRLEQAQRAERVGIRGVFGFLERHRDVALRRQVVDLVRLHLLDDPDQAGRIGQVAVMQDEAPVRARADPDTDDRCGRC